MIKYIMINKPNHLKYCIAILFLILFINPTLEANSDSLSENHFILKFNYLSFKLDSINKKKLDIIAIHSINNKIFEKHDLIFDIWNCTNETNINPYIGVIRAKVVGDYLSKTYNIHKNNFMIVDYEGSPYGINCDFGIIQITIARRTCAKGKNQKD